MDWITREQPKIDRIACPWLIKRFIDQDAIFHFVPFKLVISKAKELDAVPFDIPGVEYTHYQDQCTFDYFIKKHKIEDPALQTMATIVRAADTDRHDIASQASGIWAISAGLSFNIKDDHQLLEAGMIIYDALLFMGQAPATRKAHPEPYWSITDRGLQEILKASIFVQENTFLCKRIKGNYPGPDRYGFNPQPTRCFQESPGSSCLYLQGVFKVLWWPHLWRLPEKTENWKAIKLLETTKYSLGESPTSPGFETKTILPEYLKSIPGCFQAFTKNASSIPPPSKLKLKVNYVTLIFVRSKTNTENLFSMSIIKLLKKNACK